MIKLRPEDMKDKLAGKPDRILLAEEIRRRLTAQNFGVKIARRKTAAGWKFYFTVESLERLPSDLKWAQTAIKQYFPNSHLTSGCPTEVTIAEF